jgi:hypothetical protein
VAGGPEDSNDREVEVLVSQEAQGIGYPACDRTITS